MANRLPITVTGIPQAVQKLRTIRQSKARAALRKGINTATQQINREVKDELKSHFRTGTLEKSIGRKIVTYAKKDMVVGIVGPRTEFLTIMQIGGKQVVVDPANYMHLVEYGTVHSQGFFILATAEENARSTFYSATEAAAKDMLNGQ